MMTTRRLLLAVLAVLATLVTACTGDEATEVVAVFDDAADLTSGHAVKIADVTVGSVEAIELTDGYEARVWMSVKGDVVLPADTSARLRKTNLLGERFVELMPGDGPGEFESGTTITETSTVPELEEAVASGTDVLLAVAADRLAGAIEAGAVGMDGRGDTFGGILTDLNTMVDAYDNNSEDLVRLINGFDRFMADAGPEADVHGRALDELARFVEVLEEEDERLIDTLTEVQDLALTGTDIIQTHRQDFDAFFTRFDRLTQEVASRDPDVEELFGNAYLHNYNTIRGVNSELAQVFFDFIVCGVNDDPGDPVRACTDTPAAREKPDPRPPQGFGEGGDR